jgi:hypothetical protein
MEAIGRRPAFAVALALYLAWIAATIDEVFVKHHRQGAGFVFYPPGDFFKVADALQFSAVGGVVLFVLAAMVERVWPALDRSRRRLPSAAPSAPEG